MNQKRVYGVSTKKEKICYSLGDVGCNFVWTFMSAFLTLYYTDSVGLTAAYVGSMMLIGRIFDGASDITMGIIIEKTRTRWGKARPWILFGSLPLCIGLILLFSVPAGFSPAEKNVYVFATYLWLSVICYTVVNLSYHALLPRFSLDQQDRAVISTVRTLLTSIAMLCFANVTPVLLKVLGGQNSQRAWTTIACVYALVAMICLLICFLGVKENVPVHHAVSDKPEKTPLKPAFRSLLHTRYFYIAALIMLMGYINSGLGGGMIYFTKDVLGDMKYYGLISLVGMVPMLICMPFAPLLFKKFGKRNSILGGICVTITAYIIILTNPYDFRVVVLGMALNALGSIPMMTALFTFSGDIVDYIEWRDGMRIEGLVTSINSFGMKVGTGVGAALLGWILTIGKYDPTATIQSPAALKSMIVISVAMPLAIAVISLILVFFWDIDKYRGKINEFLQRKASDAESTKTGGQAEES